MIDRAAAAATSTPAPEPTGDGAFWAERSYWRQRFTDELPGLEASALRELLEDVVARGSVAQRLEAFDAAEKHYRAAGDAKGLTRLLELQEAAKSPEERAQQADAQTAAELHNLLRQLALQQRDGATRGVVPEAGRLTELFEGYAQGLGLG